MEYRKTIETLKLIINEINKEIEKRDLFQLHEIEYHLSSSIKFLEWIIEEEENDNF